MFWLVSVRVCTSMFQDRSKFLTFQWWWLTADIDHAGVCMPTHTQTHSQIMDIFPKILLFFFFFSKHTPPAGLPVHLFVHAGQEKNIIRRNSSTERADQQCFLGYFSWETLGIRSNCLVGQSVKELSEMSIRQQFWITTCVYGLKGQSKTPKNKLHISYDMLIRMALDWSQEYVLPNSNFSSLVVAVERSSCATTSKCGKNV